MVIWTVCILREDLVDGYVNLLHVEKSLSIIQLLLTTYISYPAYIYKTIQLPDYPYPHGHFELLCVSTTGIWGCAESKLLSAQVRILSA
jgi:hypothetical protein